MRTSEEYAKEGGLYCPVCHSANFEVEDEQGEDIYFTECWCVCGATWKEEYKLAGYANLCVPEEDDD